MHQRRIWKLRVQLAKAQSCRRQTVQVNYFYEGLYLLEDLQRMNQTFPC